MRAAEWLIEAERVLDVVLESLSREDRRKSVPAVGDIPAGTIDVLLKAHAEREPDGTWADVARTALVAHEVSIHRGSVNPLTEDLARALCDHAAQWREPGPEPELPVDVSWRDRFVLLAGHDPHPLWDR
ncbi:hypothetical protein [Pseudonocardia sp. WMMC193]|uniref:hypothetical protein n=1 Tax=Pseudonocardia sp. WMMC193 TaxID=2911965 RepID=UPI001F18BEB2|nr:hypothetical protein [Pseudonocardia sp. WMMC193]MCF7548697.1 hypothetical protein [Pseudonocardia sp. WMMC193]